MTSWPRTSPADFSELEKPLAVATTDMETGDEVFILQGDLVRAVRASSCYPGAFEPVNFNGRMLADGGIVNNLPRERRRFFRGQFFHRQRRHRTPSRRLF